MTPASAKQLQNNKAASKQAHQAGSNQTVNTGSTLEYALDSTTPRLSGVQIPINFTLLEHLQRTIGNQAVQRLLLDNKKNQQVASSSYIIQRSKEKSFNINVGISPSEAIIFHTNTATIGGVSVYFTGRMAIKGKVTLPNEEIVKQANNATPKEQVLNLIRATFTATKPIGTVTSIELPLADKTVILELANGAERLQPFLISGHFETSKIDINGQGFTITNAKIELDTTAWITPVAPVSDKVGGDTATPSIPDDGSVKKLSFAGVEAQFKDKTSKKEKDRSATIIVKAWMDAFEAKAPDFVKQNKHLRLPEQRAAFFQEMRAYFGTDDKTIEHFSKLRKTNIKGATTILHDEAATRLEAVQAEIGEALMPVSGGVGWPRAECSLAGKQDTGNLHNLGFAVDFNAFQAPHIKDQRTLDLIQIITGRSATTNYDSSGVDTRKVGQTFTSGTPEEKAKLEADPKIQEWLNKVSSEADSVSKASEMFRSSLTSTDSSGAVTDGSVKLIELREKWFATEIPEERQKLTTSLPDIIKPWLQKIGKEKADTEGKITNGGFIPAKLPTGKDLETVIEISKKLSGNIKKLQSKLGVSLKKSQRTQLDELISSSYKQLGESGNKPADDAGAIIELRRLAGLVAKQYAAFVQKKWLDRVDTLYTTMKSDPNYVFGYDPKDGKHPKNKVENPSPTQIVDTGFFNLSGKSKAGKAAFGVDFVRSMVKHGFTHGATWSTPDLMHFELRWKGPGQK